MTLSLRNRGGLMRFILWLIISCMGVFNPCECEVVSDAPNPYEDEWIVEDAPSIDDVWIIEDADDPFAEY